MIGGQVVDVESEKTGPVSYTHLDVYKRQLHYCAPALHDPWL